MKRLGKQLLRAGGLKAQRIQAAGGHLRPIGDLVSFLEDVRARGFMPPVIFDVGASDGAWTRIVEPVFPDAKFLLVEPRPATQPALAEFCRARPGCTVATCAVGATPGEGVLTDWDTASTLLPAPPESDAPQVSVRVDTLDTLAAHTGVPALVKLDVEGFEIEALRGARSLLGTTEMFIVEVGLFKSGDRPLLDDVVAFMRSHDYFVYDVCGFIRRPYDGAVGLMDLCFARANGLLRGREDVWDRAPG